MATRWREHQIEKMCQYRDEGLTEAKIAERLNIIFMTDRYTEESVNRKIRDLKRQGFLDKNKHGGRYSNELGKKRKSSILTGENDETPHKTKATKPNTSL